MANTIITYREVRYLIHDHSIEVYVRIDAEVDVPFGVQGWHYRHFVDGVDTDSDRLMDRPFKDGMWSVDNISAANSVMWPQQAPPDGR